MANFTEVWEACILGFVHHSYAPLDTLVLQLHQMLMTKLIPGEKVIFTVVSCFISILELASS